MVKANSETAMLLEDILNMKITVDIDLLMFLMIQMNLIKLILKIMQIM